jgi:hypothetical protein
MSETRYRIYTRKSGKLPKLMSLPPTEQNLFLHILRAHLQTILGKSADKQGPPELDITKFGWEIKDDIPVPAIANQLPGPTELMDVVRCNCKAVGKACATGSCSCHHSKISCTVYCACACSDECFNPFKMDDEVESNGEEVEDDEDDEDDDEEDKIRRLDLDEESE